MQPTMSMKAASVGLSAALLASLVATVAAPAAFASTSVWSAGTVPVGGTSVTPASFQFCENAAGAWHAVPGTIAITIFDVKGASTLSFTNATGGTATPTIPQNPVGLGGVTIASVAGNTVIVLVPTDDGINPLCFTVGNLYITASGNAAPGAISAVGGGTISAATYGATATTATGVLALAYPAGATAVLVNLTSPCPFVNVGLGLGPSGDFIIAGNEGGSVGIASAVGFPALGQQTLAAFAALPVAIAAGATVTQANVPNCSVAWLPAPGIVAAGTNRLVFTTQPGGGVAGKPWPVQPVVTVRDQAGATVTGFTGFVSLAVQTVSGGPGVLTCASATTLSVVNGRAAFAGCSINPAGTYTLFAPASPGTVTAATSFNFTILSPTIGGIVTYLRQVLQVWNLVNNLVSATNLVCQVLVCGQIARPVGLLDNVMTIGDLGAAIFQAGVVAVDLANLNAAIRQGRHRPPARGMRRSSPDL